MQLPSTVSRWYECGGSSFIQIPPVPSHLDVLPLQQTNPRSRAQGYQVTIFLAPQLLSTWLAEQPLVKGHSLLLLD